MNLLPAKVTDTSPLSVQLKGATTATGVQRGDGSGLDVGDDVLVAFVDGKLSLICVWPVT